MNSHSPIPAELALVDTVVLRFPDDEMHEEGAPSPVVDNDEQVKSVPTELLLAPFPDRLTVVPSIDIGIRLYDRIFAVTTWIQHKLKDPKSLGEEFMFHESGASAMPFESIWKSFFIWVVEKETYELCHRMMAALDPEVSADRLSTPLHFKYGEGAPGILSSVRLIMAFCSAKRCPLSPMAVASLRAIQTIMDRPDFPTDFIVVPTVLNYCKHDVLDEVIKLRNAVERTREPQPLTGTTSDSFVPWKELKCKGIRTGEDHIWAPSKRELNWVEFIPHLVHPASSSMLGEFGSLYDTDAPYSYGATGIPVPMEWDYTAASNEKAGSSTIHNLQHFIAQSELPNVVYVHDPDAVTRTAPTPSSSTSRSKSAASAKKSKQDAMDIDLPNDDRGAHKVRGSRSRTVKASTPPVKSIRYRRIDPRSIDHPWVEAPPSHPPKPPAHLTLSASRPIGDGNNSDVWNAIIEFQPPASDIAETASAPTGKAVHESLGDAPLPGKLFVAAKLAANDQGRAHLKNEARIYTLLHPDFSRTYNGYLLPCRSRDKVGRAAVAVVPKFYGYYVPDDENATPDQKPILLMEKCGSPIVIPTHRDAKRQPENRHQPLGADGKPIEEKFEAEDWKYKPTQKQNELLYSLLQRLHLARFSQNSFSPRNILVQPGPLCLPPSQRSLKKPSFRIIDFGRGICHDLDTPEHDNRPGLWGSPIGNEEKIACELFNLETVWL